MVLGQFSDICLWSANIRKLAKDHKGYGSAAMFPKKLSEHFNFICTTVLYKYMKSHRNDVLNYSDNMHERIKRYREFYYCIIYITNEENHVGIKCPLVAKVNKQKMKV